MHVYHSNIYLNNNPGKHLGTEETNSRTVPFLSDIESQSSTVLGLFLKKSNR